MGRPKALKPILIGCACLVPVGLVVGLSVNWNNTTFISATGSSGARGIVNGFGQKYHQENPNFEVNAESGGTATGLKDASMGLCDIGNSTNNPYKFIYNEDGSPKFDWNNMKTFTLGWEGVALIYKMPDGLSDDAQEHFDVCINQNNINDLLAVFSAYDSPGWAEEEPEQASYLHFMTEDAISYLTAGDITICRSTSIIPYVRSGGDRSASSSIAFSKCSHFTTNLTPEQTSAFEGGQYGNDRDYYETDESNAQAWSMFEYNDKPGQMVYMTTSFFNENNLKLIKEKGYKIAKYGEDEISLIDPNTGKFDLSKICVSGGYNWFRPINCSINIENENAIKFLTWIFNSLTRDDYKDLLAKYGIKRLDEEQINSMGSLIPESLETDLVLEQTRKDQVFGAEELLN